MPMKVDGRPGTGRRLPPLSSNEQFKLISTLSLGRATSHGSGERSQFWRCRRTGSVLPRVRRTEPVLRHLLLPSVPDRLPEDAVLISQSVTHGRELHRRGGFNEAGGQTPKPAVTQSRIGLLLQYFEQVEFLVFDDLFRQRSEQKIRNIVFE